MKQWPFFYWDPSIHPQRKHSTPHSLPSFYVRDFFESYHGAYYYNNNNDDPDDAYIVYIDREDYSKCYDFKFAHTYTYYITDMWQGANDKIYIMGTSDILGIYDEKTREIKYYGDLGEHYDDYHSDSSLPRWQDFDMIQAGPNHNYNWCTRGIIFCDEEKMQPQYTFNVGNVWRNYTYNDYYIEDIFSRRMFKIIPDKCNFINSCDEYDRHICGRPYCNAFIRKEKFSKSEIEDAIQSNIDKGNISLINSIAKLFVDEKITLEQAKSQLEEKNIESLNRTIMQMKIKRTQQF